MSSLRTVLALTALAVTSSCFAQFDGPAPLAWRWAQSSSVQPTGSPIISGDTVYCAIGQRMYALDKATGNQKWRYPIGEPLAANFRSSCVLAEGTLMAAADNKTIFAADAFSGQPRWQYANPLPIVGSPVAVGKFLIFEQSDNSLMALNISDGTLAWKESLRIFDGVMGSLGTYLDNVLVFTNSFKLFSIDVATRKTNWETMFSSLSPDVSATVFGDTLFVNSGEFLTALNAGTGRSKWQANIGETLAFNPAVSTDGILVTTRDGMVYGVDNGGRPTLKKPVDLGSTPVCNLGVVDKLAAICTSNGSMNLLNMKSGQIIWSFVIRPMTAYQAQPESGGAAGGGGVAGSGRGGGAGPAGGEVGGSGRGGGAAGGGGTKGPAPATYINAAGAPVLAGQTLLLIARDGSILAFDKTEGVDLTAPKVKLLFPNAGDQINGNPPLGFTFRITDDATGVNAATVKVDIDGQNYNYVLTRDGILTVDIGPDAKNAPLANGRKTITVTAADWMGNVSKTSYTVVVDNQLPPTGRGTAPAEKKTGGAGNGRGGGAGGSGRGGGGSGG
jgi:outer membrane protein assembly factor BamB